jgi:AcrR family transcriptional regulator
MYHIKEDKRAQASCNLIYQGLSKCMNEKSFSQITINDIQRLSTVSRSTFYRNFDSLIDVLYWQCDCGFKDMSSLFLETEFFHHKKGGLLLCFFEFWTKRSLILEQLLSINRIDIIYECHLKNSLRISEYFQKLQPLPDTDYDYFMGVRTGVFIGMLMVWINHEKKETPAQLLHILSQQMDFIRHSQFYI